MQLLDRVELNPLELGLLERFMKDPETVEQRMTDFLTKLQAKNKNDKYKLKLISKVAPLFEKHVFWGTQPVQKFTDYIDVSKYDRPVEYHTLD